MSIDNLMLTEHAIKRHAKRLQKQMKNYNQEVTLGESQNLLSKVLGFNDWNHLNTILKPAIEEYENNLSILKNKSQKHDDLINSFKNTSQTFFAYNLDLNAECFSDDYIDNVGKEKYNQQEDFVQLRKNIIYYEKQNIKLNELNLEFAQMLSTFPGYVIRGKAILSQDHLLREKRNQVILNILNYAINNHLHIDFNTVNKEGLNLLAILLIFTSHFEPHFKLEENLRNKILELIEIAISKTNLNQKFLDFSYFVVLFFDNFFTRNNMVIMNSFFKNIKYIPEEFLFYFLEGNVRVIPNIELFKKLKKCTENKQTNKYIDCAINGLIYKPEYFNYNKTDYSQARAVFQFLIDKKYSYDINKIQENIIMRLNKKSVDDFEITNNIKYITKHIPELMTVDFKDKLKSVIKEENDYSKYFIRTLKLKK